MSTQTFRKVSDAKEWVKTLEPSMETKNIRFYFVGNDEQFQKYLEKFNNERVQCAKRMDVEIVVDGRAAWIGCDWD